MANQEYDFQEAMAIGKTNAQERRNRGQHSGRSAKGWNYKRTVTNDNWHWIADQKKHWQSQCRDILNEYAVRCLNPINDQPEHWEF